MTADQQTWAPSPEAIERSALAGFVRWLRTERGLDFGTYAQLWSWSTADPDAFWQAIADFFDVPFHDRADRALADERMPGAVWFPGATLNYAECAVWVGPASGGTDIASGFAGVVPTEPSRAGEMQARQLGVAMEAWDPEGRPVVDEVGELVVTRPLPSMPLYFWDDPDNARYLDAYFSTYPGVWRHGDWVTVSDHGSVTVHGRSDATMNRLGVRMGSAEIYEVVDQVAGVRDCLVVGVELADGGYWMPLFVVPSETGGGTSELAAELKQLIRAEVSPRHVPDEVIFTSALPHTMTGKRMEVPVKRLLQGVPLDQAVNPSAVDDPGALDQFVALARAGRG
ncbi:acetyl-coenzyme A synthetase N-terminal domain-containing protein [Nostocoides australiense]